MREVVFATTNANKIKRLRNLLKDMDIKLLSLNDLGKNISEPEETAITCGGIAIQKALHYVNNLPKNTIVLTQDDTLSIDGVEASDNPGIHIKEPVIKKYGEFTDENAVEYYIDLANKYGGSIPISFHYGHAVAKIADNNRNLTKIISSESELKAKLVNKVNHLEKSKGYFLAAIMQVKLNDEWIYWNELTDEQLALADNDLHKSISNIFEKIGI